MTDSSERYHQIVLLQITDAETFARYGQLVAPLVQEHAGRGDRQIRPDSVQGYGPVTVVNLVSSASRAQWHALFEDPRFQEIVELRSRSTVLASVHGRSLRGDEGKSDPQGRLYLVELAEYGPGGADAYRRYSERAEAVMARYGYHVERELRPEGQDGLTLRVDVAKVAYFDAQDGLERLAADPEHAEIEGSAYTAVASRSIWVVGRLAR